MKFLFYQTLWAAGLHEVLMMHADAFDASLHMRPWCCVRGQGRRLGGTGLCGGTYRRLDLLVPFPSKGKGTEKKVGMDLCTLSIRGKSEKCYPHSAVYKYSKYDGFGSIHLYIFANYIYSVVL